MCAGVVRAALASTSVTHAPTYMNYTTAAEMKLERTTLAHSADAGAGPLGETEGDAFVGEQHGR